MATISDYLTSLQNDLAIAKTNLANLGVEVLETDTFTEISEKMANISTGGGDLSEYFTETISAGSGTSSVGWKKCVLKLPALSNTGTSCNYMFYGYDLSADLNLSKINTTNVIKMEYMFAYAKKENLDLSNFITSQVANTRNMFDHCINLKELNVNHFDVTKVTNMNSMFSNCEKLVELDLSNWETPLVTNVQNMFSSCKILESLKLTNFTITNITSLSGMFGYCAKLKYLDIRNFDFSKVTNMNSTFYNVPTDCEIIVKDETAKTFILGYHSSFTNIKTVAELEASA